MSKPVTLTRPVGHQDVVLDRLSQRGCQFIVAQPDGLDHTEAAALGLAAVTATMCLDAVDAGADTELLVNVLANELQAQVSGSELDPDQIFTAISRLHERVEGSYAAIALRRRENS